MWSPNTSIDVLKARALLLQRIRDFFQERKVFEVDVPVLGERTVTDPYLDALTVNVQGASQFLQTSPEYFMKRLLAAGSGDIYYLGKAFRADEKGRIHHPEFTMLEWYRLGFDDQQLMREVVDLVHKLDASLAAEYVSYQALFEQYLGINPHLASLEDLIQLAKKHIDLSLEFDDVNTYQELLFSHCIEPKLPAGLVVVFDYPESQAALARVKPTGQGYAVAKRFEIFLNGIELANGYFELCDPTEQKARFEADNLKRLSLGKPVIDLDQCFLGAIEAGLPECAGVALGVDRLMMTLLNTSSISEQRAF